MHEQFLPRRMAFVYDFEEVTDEGIVPDVPTTVRRSKLDCPKVGPIGGGDGGGGGAAAATCVCASLCVYMCVCVYVCMCARACVCARVSHPFFW